MCSSDGETYTSATGIGVNLEYGNYVTKPLDNCGPLAVFCRLEHANDFISDRVYRSPLVVLECAYQPSKAVDLWVNIAGVKRLLAAFYLPKGTVLADAVQLLASEETNDVG